MGNINVKQSFSPFGRQNVTVVKGSGGGFEAILALVAIVVVVAVVGSVIAALVAAITALLVWIMVTFAVVAVSAAVIAWVFRKRIAANLRPTQVVWRSNPHASPQPVRPANSKHELHLHFHGDSPDAIRRAVEAAAIAGGGTVRLPAGEFDMRENPVIRS